MSVHTIKFKISNFEKLVDKLQDLSTISDCLKIKIDKNDILVYSMISNDVSVLVLKNYLLPTQEFIEFEEDFTIDWIITSSPKFVKNIKFFNSDNVNLSLTYKIDDGIAHVRSALFTNGKLKITNIGGEQSKMRDINKTSLKTRLNPKSCKWKFDVDKSDFDDIKKLCNINSEDRILTIDVVDNLVYMNEPGKWEIKVSDIEHKNTKLVFNKKYLSNINDNEIISFEMFESFILIKDDISNLLLSFETDYSTDDE